MDSSPEIRSFRSVFALERRIYRIDTLRLNPAGVPLRGIAYAVALVVAALVAGALPPTSWLDPLIPWYLRDIGVPLAASALLCSTRIDGRAVHVAALAALTHVIGARTFDGLRTGRAGGVWRAPPVVLIPDGSDARFRALRYRGPGAVLVRGPHIRREWSRRRARLTLHPLAGSPAQARMLEVGSGTVLEVRGR